MIEKNVTGKTIVMVSASSGFGRGAAIDLASLETNVVLAAHRTEALEALAAEITNGGRIRERMKAENETRKAS